MRAWDFTVEMPNESGSLAKLGEAFGHEHMNIESLVCFEFEGRGYAHVLISKQEESRKVFTHLGWQIRDVQEVVVETIENRPGVLAEYGRHLTEAGINVTTCYLATDGRIVLGAKDLTKLSEVWTSRVPAGSHR